MIDQWRAVSRRQQREHLLDLHNLFRGAAKEPEERFAEGLAQNPQAIELDHAAGEMRIAPPRKRVSQRCEIAIGREVIRDRRADTGGNRGGRAPLEPFVFAKPHARHAVGPNPEPCVVRLAIPAKRLAAIDDLREHVAAEWRGAGERPPGGPGGWHEAKPKMFRPAAARRLR